MLEINLLPWRQTLRAKQRHAFMAWMITSILSAFIVLLFIHVIVIYMIAHVEGRISVFQRNLQLLIKQNEKKSCVIQDMHNTMWINKMQQNQQNFLHFIYALGSMLPGVISLTQLTQHEQDFELEGLTKSSVDLMDFMQNLNDASGIQNTQMLEMKKIPHSSELRFRLKVTI